MICEKCIHNNICKYGEARGDGGLYCTGEKCKQFKSESHYLELPFQPGEEVYICATVDWDLGIIPATIWDMTAYYDQKTKEFYWMFNVDHEHVYGKSNPNLIVNRYNFTEEEIAKTKEEALQKRNDRALQMEAKRKVNR